MPCGGRLIQLYQTSPFLISVCSVGSKRTLPSHLINSIMIITDEMTLAMAKGYLGCKAANLIKPNLQMSSMTSTHKSVSPCHWVSGCWTDTYIPSNSSLVCPTHVSPHTGTIKLSLIGSSVCCNKSIHERNGTMNVCYIVKGMVITIIYYAILIHKIHKTAKIS